MCGLAGFIGESKDKKLSFDLISSLFFYSQIRGIDACGFYANEKENIFYHKQKGKSNNLIQSDIWKNLKDKDLDLMLVHTRKTSSNSGSSENNINNHPFLLGDSALIHNGIIEKNDFNKLLNYVKIDSDCDSEIIIKFMNCFSSENYFDNRLSKLQELLFFIRNSEFAFCLTDKNKESKNLWLVKNDKRPLFLINLKESLNQYFFCSTLEIWQESISNIKNLKGYNIYKIPDFSIININYFNNNFKEYYFNYDVFDFEEKLFKY